MLSVVWILITVVIAALLWISSNLLYTAGFFLMLGVSGALLLNCKWIYAIISLCCTLILLAGAFYFEPGWVSALLKVFSFSTL